MTYLQKNGQPSQKLVTELIALTTQVGEHLLALHKQKNPVVTIKDNHTPLTIADQKSHQLICQALARLTPNIPIISEEAALPDFAVRRTWPCYWLIDPLDGTRDFLAKNGQFTINIALIENNVPILGLIYVPYFASHYFAQPNQGAFKKDQTGITQIYVNKNVVKPIRVVVGNYSQKSKRLQAFLAQTFTDHAIFQTGSALKFCYVAEGKYDFYPRLGPCFEWDTAAGVCILEAAGGTVLDENKQPLHYNQSETAISPVFFASAF